MRISITVALDVPKQVTTFYVALSQPHKVKEPLLNARTTAPHRCELVSEGSVCALESYGKTWTKMGHVTSLSVADVTPHSKEAEQGTAAGSRTLQSKAMLTAQTEEGKNRRCGGDSQTGHKQVEVRRL